MHFVYILYSPQLDRFYIGESADPNERLEHHLAGPPRFTRRAADWVMVFYLPTASRTEALVFERKIKQSKSRKTVVRWIQGSDNQIEAAVWQRFAW